MAVEEPPKLLAWGGHMSQACPGLGTHMHL